MNKILVTGGCGYIGSHICKNLSSLGYKVIVIDDLSTGFKENLLHDEILYIDDFTNKHTLQKIVKEHKIEAVIHMAASISVSESCDNPSLYYENNFVKTKTLIENLLSLGVNKLIFSSTAAVYGQIDEELVTEDSPLAPINPYGKSKLACEWLISDLAKTANLKYCILRYFNVAGCDPDRRIGQRCENATHLIKKICQAVCKKNQIIKVFGNDYPTCDGTGVRDYIHVEDLSTAHIEALNHLSKEKDNLTLNCGYSNGYSVLQVISAMEKVIGKKLTTQIHKRRSGDGAQLVANSRKIKNILNWTPKFNNLEIILNHALAWEKTLYKQ
jgi:UDP-glucose 4-epimerase